MDAQIDAAETDQDSEQNRATDKVYSTGERPPPGQQRAQRQIRDRREHCVPTRKAKVRDMHQMRNNIRPRPTDGDFQNSADQPPAADGKRNE